jgi:hypothetical protein
MGIKTAPYRLTIDLAPLFENEITAVIDAAEDRRASILVTDRRCVLIFKQPGDRDEFRELWGGEP